MKHPLLHLFTALTCLLLVWTVNPTYAERDREILRLGRAIEWETEWKKDGTGYAVKIATGVEIRDANGHLQTTLNFPEGRMDFGYSTLEWSPNGEYLAFIPNHYTIVRVWSVKEQALLRHTLAATGTFAWKPDSTQFAIGPRIYDMDTGRLLLIHAFGGECFSCGETHDPNNRIYEGGEINWSPDGTRFISISYVSMGSSGYYFGIFDATNDQLITRFDNGRFTDTYRRTLLWNWDSTKITDGYQVWEANDGSILSHIIFEQLKRYKNGLPSCQTKLIAWSLDGQSVFHVSEDCVFYGQPFSLLSQWDSTTGNVVSQQPISRQLVALGWEQNKLIARTSEGHRLTINTTTNAVQEVDYTNAIFPVSRIAWSPDSQKLVAVAVGSPNLPMQMWDIEAIRNGGAALPLWTKNTEWYHSEEEAFVYPPTVAKVVWNDAGLITVTEDPYIWRTFHAATQWDAATGNLQKYLHWSQGDFQSPTAEPSPDLKYLAVTGMRWLQSDDDEQFPIEIVDTSTRQVIKRFMTDSPDELHWSPDGRYLATTGWNRHVTQIWDVSNAVPNLLVELNGGVEMPVVWSQNSQQIVIGHLIYTMPFKAPISQIGPLSITTDARNNRVVWNASGENLATSTFDRQVSTQSTVRIFEISTSFSTVVSQIDGEVNDIALSPDGTMLALGMDDGTIHIWDVADLMAS